MGSGSGAGAGSVAGASGDAGVEYRRGVAAYAVTCGLAGVPLLGIEIAPRDTCVAAVSLETDDSVDDIRIELETGWRAFVQAKRSLNAGKPLKTAVAQWLPAVRAGLNPTRDRLVIVAGTLSGSMRDLQRVLNRKRSDCPGSPTTAEKKALSQVRALLTGLSDEECDLVLRCAVIWELQVEEEHQTHSQRAVEGLRSVLADNEYDTARRAWATLMSLAGRAARLRGGYTIDGWHNALRGEGFEFRCDGSAPAAQLEVRHAAIGRYRARLHRTGTHLDLRGLGAEVPAMVLDEADASVTADEGRELVWAFLRRGRMILTGLPGGGKTTALKRLTAQLASDDSLPFPVFVPLRAISNADTGSSFRDRLVSVAVRDDSPADRAMVADDINRRLDSDGKIALILDSLDETYDCRARIVSDIASMLDGLPSGICVLLATRDIAYGQAATLRWPSLRLGPPAAVDRTVTAVLRASADHLISDQSARGDWIAERETWVQSALSKDEMLRETPLIPVLLAILAIRRSPARLPGQRAKILETVIRDIVADRELHRTDGRTLGPLDGSALGDATMHAFVAEAAEILNSQGRADTKAVVDAVAGALREPWDLPSGHASTAAREAVALFDETGIFVNSGAEETIAPRIALFAEIGDAVRITTRAAEIREWVRDRISAEQFEPLVLACILDTAVTHTVLEALHTHPTDIRLANVLVRAFRDGAELDDDAIGPVCECLIANVATGTPHGWFSWEDLLHLPIPAALRADAQAAADLHSPEHALVAQASLQLHFYHRGGEPADPQVLEGVLALEELPVHPSSHEGLKFDLRLAISDQTLSWTREQAAAYLLDHVEDATGLVVDIASATDTPSGLREAFTRLLTDRGLNAEATAVNTAIEKELAELEFPSWLSDYDPSKYSQFLRVIAGHRKAELSTEQATRTDELADFLDTLAMNSPGAGHLYKQPPGFVQQVVELTSVLYGFDPAILAAEAAIIDARMERSNSTDPYFALFDTASPRSVPDWPAVADPARAMQIVGRLFRLGLEHARFAALSLSAAPIAEYAGPELRRLLPILARSPRRHYLAAAALASLPAGPEPDCWIDSDEPVLRRVAALGIEPTIANTIADRFRPLLNDPDGHVQEAAIKNVVAAGPTDLAPILHDISRRPAPGWTCLSCRTLNEPAAHTKCANAGCFTIGPDPAKLAEKHLRNMEHARSDGATSTNTSPLTPNRPRILE